MDQAAFDQYRVTRYEPAIAWYDARAQKNQKSYRRLQWLLAWSAALTPVFIGFDFIMDDYIWAEPWFKLIPLGTSGVVAASAAAQSSFKFEKLWLNYRATCEALRREIHLHGAGQGEYEHAPDRNRLFVGRVEELMARETRQWEETLKDNQHIRTGV